MLDYTIPVIQFIIHNGSSQLELYESSDTLSYSGPPADRRSFLEHQAMIGEPDSCRIVAFPPDGMASAPPDEWALLWFRNGSVPGDVRVSVLRAFEDEEEDDSDAIIQRITLGGWSISEILAGETDEKIADELADELITYCNEVCAQPDWADDIMESTNALVTDIIEGWQRTQVVDPTMYTNDVRITEPGIYFVIDSDETRLPAGMAVQITAGPGVTLCCHTQHNVVAEAGSTVFVYGATNLLMEEGSAAYIANGRSVTTLGKCDLMVLRDAGQIHCYGERPNFDDVKNFIVLNG